MCSISCFYSHEMLCSTFDGTVFEQIDLIVFAPPSRWLNDNSKKWNYGIVHVEKSHIYYYIMCVFVVSKAL